MLSSDPDSAEDTAVNDAPTEAEEEEQEDEQDSPAESDVPEEVGVHVPHVHLEFWTKAFEISAMNSSDQLITFNNYNTFWSINIVVVQCK